MANRVSSGFNTKEELTFRDVINITSNPPTQRSRKQLQAISDWIRRSTALFSDMDKDIVYNVMKNCKCQVLVKDTVVIKQGEKGDAFYIILHGKVSVYVNEAIEQKKSLLNELLESDEEREKPPTPELPPEKEMTEDDEEEKKTGPSVRQRFRKTLTKLKITQQVTTKLKKPSSKPNPREGLGQKVAEMSDGKSFGELALLNGDNKREASCVTENDAVFLVVAKDLYNKSIKSFQTRQQALIRRFVSQHPFFAHWPSKMQAQVLNSVIQLKQKAGETILKEGQTYNGLFFLIQGEVKVTVNNSNHCKPQVDTTDASTEDNSTQRQLGHSEILRSLAMPHVHVKRRGGYSGAEYFQSNRHKDLCLSGPTITFGDIEHILGMSSYIQTIVAESSSQLFQINKENWERLLKLANNMGHAVSAPTMIAMSEMAYTTWQNRLEKVSAKGEELSCLRSMIRKLLNHPTMRPKDDAPTTMSKEEKLFESLISSYLKDQTPLIPPFVEGGHYYRSLMRERAELRKKQKDRTGTAKPAYSLQPLKNSRIPRSIATLKEQIKKYNSSDVDLIIPPSKRPALEPILQTPKPENTTEQTGSLHTYDALSTMAPTQTLDNEIFHTSKPPQELDIFLEDKGEDKDEKILELLLEQVGNETTFDDNTAANLKVDPVLITEKHDKFESVELAQGKALKFYSQYLKGRINEEHDTPRVDPEVAKNNRDADKLEQKMLSFLEAYNGTNGMSKLHRIDESKDAAVLPGGRCLVERSPCKLQSKDLPLQAHEHVKRYIVEHV